MPDILRAFLVAVVALEQAVGLISVGPDDDLTVLAHCAALALSVENVDVIGADGLAHGAQARLGADQGTDGEGGLGLAKALHDL